MAESLRTDEGSSSTVVVESEESENAVLPSVRMKLKKAKAKKKVAWTADTVDNEHMDKKKSKCCCIYEKPKAFDESSSESDDECEHCKGHVERKHNPVKVDASEETNHIDQTDAGPK